MNKQLQLNSKRAMATTTFAWIFMTIVGGVLIMFTYSIIQGYWQVEDQSNRLEFSKALTNSLNVMARNVLSNSAVNSDTFPLLSQKEANLLCLESEFSRLNLDGEIIAYEPLNTYLDNYPVFMPPLEDEEPDSLFILLEEFSYPMSITPLVGIIPTHHVVIINQSSVISNIVNRVQEDKSVYSQFTFIHYDSTLDFNIFLDEVENFNPSSMLFVDFNSSVMVPQIDSRYRNVDFEVYVMNINFLTLPSYITPSNEEGNVLGTFRYIYSNREVDYIITGQESTPINPKNYRFVGLNDEVSLLLFSFFSSPSNFECAYNSLVKAVKLRYEHILNKIEIVQDSNLILNTTYCEGSRSSSNILNTHYTTIKQNIENLYTNENQNFLNHTSPNPSQRVIDIRETNAILRQQSCELVY